MDNTNTGFMTSVFTVARTDPTRTEAGPPAPMRPMTSYGPSRLPGFMAVKSSERSLCRTGRGGRRPSGPREDGRIVALGEGRGRQDGVLCAGSTYEYSLSSERPFSDAARARLSPPATGRSVTQERNRITKEEAMVHAERECTTRRKFCTRLAGIAFTGALIGSDTMAVPDSKSKGEAAGNGEHLAAACGQAGQFPLF